MASSALNLPARPRPVASDWRALAPLLAVLVGCWLVSAGLPLNDLSRFWNADQAA
jgi:hypothetical protein